MSIIQVENLTFSYPTSYDTIFDHVSFRLDTDWKLGFIGRNGRGKTTFLKLLMGELDYSGNIISSVPFQYFPHPVEDPDRLTEEILMEICPLAEQWEILRELAELDAGADILWRPFATLSNGEQTKALLAAHFLEQGKFMLIDEPTNHLDTGARATVSAYLKRKKGFLLVSHDRRFLDGCVDHIVSLNRSDITVRSGNVSSWMLEFEQRQALEHAQQKRLQQDVKRLRQAARRSTTWSDRVEASKVGALDKGYVGHKAAKMMKRAKALEARQQRAIDEKVGLLKNAETAEELKLSPLVYHADTLVMCSEVVVHYDGKPVCAPVSFTLRQGERVVLEGKNGSGKSSLLKLLLGEAIVHTGTMKTGSGLIVSYVPQDTADLHGSLTAYAQQNGIEDSQFKAILRKMGLERVQFEKDIREFSSGQKKKVLLAGSLCTKAHLYVWDEPLNFIDIYSRMQIEQLLQTVCPTMLFVEHDKAFQEAVATRTVCMQRACDR
ncbi:MAG: ABC-F type ribosomal protection protein [Eubacteriales bacterium]|nr:ABC-F type ribosomal protection protein [Eubacteriales bacterium]